MSSGADQWMENTLNQMPQLEAPRLLAACELVAEELRRRAVPCRGGVTWLSVEQDERGKLTPLGPNLYRGTSGIAFFLAALFRVTGREEHRELTLRAIGPLRQKISELVKDPERERRLRLRIGGMTGIASWLYALVRISGWLEESVLLQEAEDLTLLFSPERIQQDINLDVVHGSAGAILALLTLDEVRSQANATGATALDIAGECGRHLLAQRVTTDLGPRAWPPVPGSSPLTGFSHGAAGICYALSRLWLRTGSPDLLAAIKEGLAYERALFSLEHGNWRDLRVRAPEPRFMTAWCHGAPGIALGRLGLLEALGDSHIRSEIRIGLATTRQIPFDDVDHLCCGNAGRAEILHEAYRRLGELADRYHAEVLLKQILEHATCSMGDEESQLSLLRGTTGVGYTLLRWLDPETLPCMLLLQ